MLLIVLRMIKTTTPTHTAVVRSLCRTPRWSSDVLEIAIQVTMGAQRATSAYPHSVKRSILIVPNRRCIGGNTTSGIAMQSTP